MTDPPLARTLRLVLPDESLTAFLRACLLGPGQAGSAWEHWLQSVGDAKAFFVRDRVGVKRHLPLLYGNLHRAGADIPRDLQPYLRTALLREELRAVRYRKYLRQALAALHEHHVPYVLAKGAAVAETLYPAANLRHCHDIDALLPPDRLDDATRALAEADFTRLTPPTRRHDLKISHHSGLPIELHTRLLTCPLYGDASDVVLSRAVTVDIMGVPTPVQTPADLLAHLCVHAFSTSSRLTLAWACDSVFLLRKHPNPHWSQVTELAARCRVELPLWVMLSYLREQLEAPVPPEVLGELGRAARGTPAARRDAALEAVRIGPRGSLRNLLTRGSWRDRLDTLRWMALPTSAYLRWVFGERRTWRLPLWYLLRPFRFLRRRARRFLPRRHAADVQARPA